MAEDRKKLVQVIREMREDIRALNASVQLIAQKLKTISRNEKILARNILVLNKKIKEIQERPVERGGEVDQEAINKMREDLFLVRSKVEELSASIESLKKDVEGIKAQMVTREEFSRVKYLVETINPLEFVTYKDVSEIVEKKIREVRGA